MSNNAPAPPCGSSERSARLRGLIDACQPGTNRHDQAIVAITACIEEGLNTRAGIIAEMRQLGFDPRHVAITLNGGSGVDPRSHRWRRDAAGQYALLN